MAPTQREEWHIGAGMYDITGPAAEAGMFGYAKASQSTSGIHMRLRSRAFAFQYKSQHHFIFISVDIGIMTECVTHRVLQLLENEDRIPKNIYSRENVILSAVHTHCAPGGLSHFGIYSHHPPLRGFDAQNFEVVVSGIVESIVRAYSNLQPGIIRVSSGDCLGASVNRSLDAYNANPQEERDEYQFDTDKEMVLWRLDGTDGFPIGMINWFAVHPTSMGSWYTLITGDNKGYASHVFEKEQGTHHYLDKPRSFVAAFAQSNEGDVSPNVFGPRDTLERRDDYSRMLHVANVQLDTARRLYQQAASSEPLQGPLRTIHQYVDYNQIQLSEEFHTHTDCDASTGRGCPGISMLSGTLYDGRGISIVPEGVKWDDCHGVTLCPELQNQHKEKPVAFPTSDWGLSPSVLPLQLVVVGTMVVASLPFEATTMAGRRIQKCITSALSDLGIEKVIIAGLSNAYCGYLTTREEYSVQRYEGASTHFGPNQLSATLQQFHGLAKNLVDNTKPTTVLPPSVRFGKSHWQLPVVHDGVLLTTQFGDVIDDVSKEVPYTIGETVVACFQAGHPKNNLRTQQTFLQVLRWIKDDLWICHATDDDVNTMYEWERSGVLIDTSRVKISWTIPKETKSGWYRIKHIGDYKTAWGSSVIEYSGSSSSFCVLASEGASVGPRPEI